MSNFITIKLTLNMYAQNGHSNLFCLSVSQSFCYGCGHKREEEEERRIKRKRRSRRTLSLCHCVCISYEQRVHS